MAAPQRSLRLVPGPAETQQRVASAVVALADINGVRHADLADLATIDADKLSKSLSMKRKLTLEEMTRLADALEVPVAVLHEGGEEIRRRARVGVLVPTGAGPYPPGGQEISQEGCSGGRVVDLWTRQIRHASRAAAA